jgi:hypothetical protein
MLSLVMDAAAGVIGKSIVGPHRPRLGGTAAKFPTLTAGTGVYTFSSAMLAHCCPWISVSAVIRIYLAVLTVKKLYLTVLSLK